MLIFLFILTFTNIGILILLGAVMRESRHQKRSGGQLPPSTPRAGGQASQRPVSGASAEQLPQVNPAQQHAAEAQRSRFPARNCGGRPFWGEIGVAAAWRRLDLADGRRATGDRMACAGSGCLRWLLPACPAFISTCATPGTSLSPMRGKPARADGTRGAFQQPGRTDLPALDQRPPADPGRRRGRPCPHRTRRALAWHECGTNGHEAQLMIGGQPARQGSELGFRLARLAGLEPATGCLEGSCSIRLSYRRPDQTLCTSQVTCRTPLGDWTGWRQTRLASDAARCAPSSADMDSGYLRSRRTGDPADRHVEDSVRPEGALITVPVTRTQRGIRSWAAPGGGQPR